MEINERNPQVHPATEDHGLNSGHPGMSLRDWFAGLAMQSIILMPADEMYQIYGTNEINTASYNQADRMLSQRRI